MTRWEVVHSTARIAYASAIGTLLVALGLTILAGPYYLQRFIGRMTVAALSVTVICVALDAYAQRRLRLAPTAILRCSFCNRSQNDVRKLIAGPHVFICDECVDVCVGILGDESRVERSDGSAAPLSPPKGPA